MRKNPMVPNTVPSTAPAAISRRMTRHQSRNRTSPSAIARITSVEAWDPELPPLEMMSGTNNARMTALAISSSKNAIAVAVSISPKNSAELPLAVENVGVGRNVPSGPLLRLAPEVSQSLGHRHVRSHAHVPRIHEAARLILGVREQSGDLGPGRLVEQRQQPAPLIVGCGLDDVGDVIGGKEPNPMPALARRQGEQHAGLVSSA